MLTGKAKSVAGRMDELMAEVKNTTDKMFDKKNASQKLAFVTRLLEKTKTLRIEAVGLFESEDPIEKAAGDRMLGELRIIREGAEAVRAAVEADENMKGWPSVETGNYYRK